MARHGDVDAGSVHSVGPGTPRKQLNDTFREAGVDYQVAADGDVDFEALGHALGKRYPRITRYLAE